MVRVVAAPSVRRLCDIFATSLLLIFAGFRYGSLVEATHASAHRSHLAALIRASPLATSLSRLGFGPAEIGRLVGDATLGLSSAQDLKHVRCVATVGHARASTNKIYREAR